MFAPWRQVETGSPVIDLAEGASPGSKMLRSTCNRKWRQLERDYGRVEVELKASDPAMLELCLKWKSAQYRRTGVFDLFTRPWARTLAEAIASQDEPEFAGTVSVLHVGGQPIAAHLGMRSSTVWHYWFPAYDPEFQRYSPGMLLLLEMIAGAPTLGLKIIDFGKGDSGHKLRLANRRMPLIEGSVVTDQSLLRLRQKRAKVKQWVQGAPFPHLLSSPVSKLVRWGWRKILFR
jgi:CelD/BcsL family acetyltransferase involved in cellulose biosynthesis